MNSIKPGNYLAGNYLIARDEASTRNPNLATLYPFNTDLAEAVNTHRLTLERIRLELIFTNS